MGNLGVLSAIDATNASLPFLEKTARRDHLPVRALLRWRGLLVGSSQGHSRARVLVQRCETLRRGLGRAGVRRTSCARLVGICGRLGNGGARIFHLYIIRIGEMQKPPTERLARVVG